MEETDNEAPQSPPAHPDTEAEIYCLYNKPPTSIVDISWPPAGSGVHARSMQPPPRLRKSPAAAIHRGTQPLRRSHPIKLSRSNVQNTPHQAGIAGDPSSIQVNQGPRRRSSSVHDAPRRASTSKDEKAQNSHKGVPRTASRSRRVSLTGALASLHSMNKEQQGTERIGAVLVCCITALFLGHVVFERILLGRRKKSHS